MNNWGNTVVMSVDGILRNPNDSAPIMSGVLLYHSLVKSHRVNLVFDTAAREKVQHWLRINNLTEHAGEIYWELDDPEDIVERRELQIARIRAQGSLSLMVESNPAVAEMLLVKGIPTLLYMHPSYMRPEHRPDYQEEITPWGSLLEEVKRQRTMRSMDTRLNDEF